MGSRYGFRKPIIIMNMREFDFNQNQHQTKKNASSIMD